MTHSTTIRRPAPAIWAFIVADCFSFAIFFSVFMVERRNHAKAFARSARNLDLSLGLINTLILLTSGLLVALATSAARRRNMASSWKLLIAALLIGSGFGIIKVIEYALKIRAGLTPLTGGFFLYYYLLTGLHFLHYLAGLIVLIVLILKTPRGGSTNPGYEPLLEGGALYWHLVDLLWLFIFPIIYMQVNP